jgi:hypothetical protein
VEQDPERAAAMMLGLGDSRVLGVSEDEDALFVEVETALDVTQVRCPGCSSVVVLDGADEVERPGPGQFFGRWVTFSWRVRRFRCPNAECKVETFSEEVPQVSGA